MVYSALVIADQFLRIAWDSAEVLDPMKLQKLVYFAHGWHLALTDGDPLIREGIEAWKFGPVIPSIYHAFKKYGAQPIDRPVIQNREAQVDAATLALLEKVWELYGHYSGWRLSNLSHAEGSPWRRTYRGHRSRGAIIANCVIRDYFKEQMSA